MRSIYQATSKIKINVDDQRIQTPLSMAGSVGAVLDALPYIDNEFEDPELRESVRRIRYFWCDVLLRFFPQAMRFIEEETKRYRPTKNYLEYLPTPKITFESPLLHLEMERLSARQPMEVLSMKRLAVVDSFCYSFPSFWYVLVRDM